MHAFNDLRGELGALRLRLIRGRAAAAVGMVTRHRILHCLGDSHVRVFDAIERHHLIGGVFIETRMVPGATALGMANPNSRTDALGIFRTAVGRLPSRSTFVLMLGEVDCGFLLWHRAEHLGVDLESETERSLANYLGFARELSEAGGRPVICAVPLPTIRDGEIWGAVAQARSEVHTTLRDRTSLTKRYNDRLRDSCNASGWPFLDTSAIEDPETGVISDAFRHADPLDHHLSNKAFAPVMASELVRVGLAKPGRGARG